MAWEIAIPAALSIAGSATKAAGSYKGGQAQSKADLYRAQVSKNMATSYENAAERVAQGGVVQSDVEGLRTAAAVGHAKAAAAASGIDVNRGSTVDVRAAISQAGRLNQLTTLSNANLQAYGYRVKAAEATAQAGLETASAEGAKQGGAASAMGSLISGASALPFGWISDQFSTGSTTPGSGTIL